MSSNNGTAETTEPTIKTPPSMGLNGVWGIVANMSAVALVCALFYMSFSEHLRLSREDRVMFRQVLATLEERAEKDRQTTRDSFRELAAAIRELKERE